MRDGAVLEQDVARAAEARDDAALAREQAQERHAELEKARGAIWKGLEEVTRDRLTEASNAAPIGMPS